MKSTSTARTFNDANTANPLTEHGYLPASSGSQADSCFHCGLPVPSNSNWHVTIDSVPRAMCCPGCEAVAQTIVDSGLGDYYATRDGFSVTAADTLVPPELLLYDAQDAKNQTSGIDAAGVTARDVTFSVEGIRCAACVWLIERRVARVPGVQSVDMNVTTERLRVQWSSEQCKPSDILRSMREIGYAAYPYDPVRHGEQIERARKTLFRKLFIAGLSMMQVMMYALPVYLANDGTMDDDMTNLMRWAGLLLTLPAVFYSAQPFFLGAWRNLKNRLPGMDVPVALGIAAAFVGSVVATVRGEGDVYFDSVTMFIFLLLGSRYLELAARRKAATALDNLQHAVPASAYRMVNYPASREVDMIPAGQLHEGDIILVKPGEAIAADGVIVEGDTDVDVALLTGESKTQKRIVGANVPGGAVNMTQAIVLRVTRSAQDSTLSLLVKMIERAGHGKPQLALWADKVAAWFVVALLFFTVAVFIAWQFVDPSCSWAVAIAVLVVSCPCALSLATPTALAAATDRLVRQGALIVQPHVLETLHRATHVIFDKTGTLTVGKPVVRTIEPLAEKAATWCLQLAAALEESSAHPLGIAIIESAKESGAALFDGALHHVRQTGGQGLEGLLDGVAYRLGSAAFVRELTGCASPRPATAPGADLTSIWLGSAAGWLARFDLADGLRDDAAEVIRYFQASSKVVILLSGDQQNVTRQVADQLGIGLALGEHLPDQKLAYVQGLQRDGAIVAMVGDGINDAAVLSAADVSFAMGGGAAGTALAQLHADCVLLSGRIASMSDVAESASQTIAVIRQNLAWATLYNVVAIPAAAFGLLNPWLSGIGMSVSSAVVVINALRLRRPSRPSTSSGLSLVKSRSVVSAASPSASRK